ncbi:MAG: hypothetical protein ACYCSJ_05415 [Acidimicrobiales bacterium]
MIASPSRAPRGPRPARYVLPRPERPDRPNDPAHQREDREGGLRAGPRRSTDDEALALREQGKSYSAVARSLGLTRATDARQAFLRSLRARPEDERRAMAVREQARLDGLEARIRARDAGRPEKLQRRLEALGVLREGLE